MQKVASATIFIMTYKPEQIPIGYLIHQAHRAVHQAINMAFHEAEIPFAIEQWPVMMEIFNSNGASQQFIANKIKKDKTSVTRLIGTLERNGLVVCKADTADRRKKLVFYTEKADQIRSKSVSVLSDINRQIMKDVSAENEQIFRDVLTNIFSNLNWNFEFMNIKNRN